MFERSIRFFIERYRLNHALFLLILGLGIYAYFQLPKELSPRIEPDAITIRGHYSGASIDTLNTMAVSELEAKIRTLDGIASITSTITPGRFTTVAELERGIDKDQTLKAIEDAIASIRSNLPPDMDDPTVRSVAHSRSLMHIAILSKTLPRERLLELAQQLQSKILKIHDVSDVTIFGDSEPYYEIALDPRRLQAYGLDMESAVRAVSELSYILPLGEISGRGHRFFLSGRTRYRDAQEIGQTLLHFEDRAIRLDEIATITKRYDDMRTLASMNGQDAVTLAISQNPKGDALRLAKRVKQLIRKMHIDGATIHIRRDQSRIIRERLDVVVSNILFALLLIITLITLLINARMALVIALGIPTSFLIGALAFHVFGYSININSLIGVLIALGIIVDDAIVVSENIQQYIQKGYAPAKAAFLGAREMAAPVTVASLTTIFSFIPLLMISGRLGEIIQMIPIALSILVLASLLESFLFLPVHAAHILRPGTTVRSWKGAETLYRKLLRFLARYHRGVLLFFLIVVPLAMTFQIQQARFQMFQRFDSDTVDITFKASPDTPLEESLKIVQTLERDLLAQKKRFAIRQISSTAGYRRSATGTTEIYPYVGYLSIELAPRKAENFYARYIEPILSFYRQETPRTRERSSQTIARDLRRWLKRQNYRRRFKLQNLSILERRMGHTKADIRIGVISADYTKALHTVKEIEKALRNIPGVKEADDNIKYGVEEIKIALNDYGKKLGITRRYLGEYLSRLYLPRKVGVVFSGTSLLEIRFASFRRNELLAFENLRIPLRSGSHVALREIASLKRIHTLERLVKDDGETTFYLYANIDPKIATDDEILEKIRPLLEQFKAEGIRFQFRGEAQQKRTVRTEMLLASLLAILLIFVTILALFNSVSKTLIVMSVIPLSFFGAFAGHALLGLNISLPSLIGALGLAGVIVNDGIIMMDTLRQARTLPEVFERAARRLRPILLTTLTTLLGLFPLIFFASSEAVAFQPIAVSLGFGLLWGTLLNLLYLPLMYLLVSPKLLSSPLNADDSEASRSSVAATPSTHR